MAGVVQSALFMAGAALVVRRIAIDRGLSPGWRRVAVGCFALQPMIVLYGGSGLSEAAEVFFTLFSVRYLFRWVDDRRPAELACAGVALGFGYLARYEVLPAALGATALVAALSIRWGQGRPQWAAALANIATASRGVVDFGSALSHA
jgi:4-amino-4-deoxy-L-arabinose transferase-like glycosyltransferase